MPKFRFRVYPEGEMEGGVSRQYCLEIIPNSGDHFSVPEMGGFVIVATKFHYPEREPVIELHGEVHPMELKLMKESGVWEDDL